MQRGRRGVGLGPFVFGWELRPELRLKTDPEVGNPEIHRAARTKLHVHTQVKNLADIKVSDVQLFYCHAKKPHQ